VVLLKLKKTGEASTLTLSASYENRSGESFSSESTFEFSGELEVAPNTGIQKAILLSRYVNLMQEWIAVERQHAADIKPIVWPLLEDEIGLSEWERTSLSLVVSSEYKQLFQEFLTGFAAERTAIGDEALRQEEELLQGLIDWQADSSSK
jgi:hypothetical protein